MKLTYRPPDDLSERLRASAEKNHRSLNAEITWRLEEGFRLEDGVLYDLRPLDSHVDTDPPDGPLATAAREKALREPPPPDSARGT